MMPGTVGLAAELGLQLSNVLWRGVADVLAAIGALCVFSAACLVLSVAADVRRARRRQRQATADDTLDIFGGTSDAEIERHVSEWSRQQGGRNG